MFSLSEIRGQSSLLHKHGTVEFNTTYVTRRKPLWLIALQLLGVTAMVAAGYGLLVPALVQIHLALWQAVALASGLMMLYVGIAFFVRPEANTDNMGWGWGGMMDDPTQYSDDVNRGLWSAHCILGPGRFTAETFLDTCAVLGLAHRDEVIDDSAATAVETSFSFPDSMLSAVSLSAGCAPAGPAPAQSGDSHTTPVVNGLNPNRFELPPARRD